MSALEPPSGIPASGLQASSSEPGLVPASLRLFPEQSLAPCSYFLSVLVHRNTNLIFDSTDLVLASPFHVLYIVVMC